MFDEDIDVVGEPLTAKLAQESGSANWLVIERQREIQIISTVEEIQISNPNKGQL